MYRDLGFGPDSELNGDETPSGQGQMTGRTVLAHGAEGEEPQEEQKLMGLHGAASGPARSVLLPVLSTEPFHELQRAPQSCHRVKSDPHLT